MSRTRYTSYRRINKPQLDILKYPCDVCSLPIHDHEWVIMDVDGEVVWCSEIHDDTEFEG